ncbi:ATP-dependent helicase HrpB [Bacterioplanes sanyensis]|uniref:ATP-dependent helicase HrpB n=1 Tax=Bacterioplanes sanyensis TaxID=1249553 RepID=A0A222FMF0_9GAMM|nr:ATP-dependent helicase HrpB [Bacterioplanes sanyensis]ASP40198.1 ATP-dependent helicase HrpB [Bacterioplanes sanyensis]
MTTSLPIDALLSDIQQYLSQNHNVVLTAEPGAGKTTRLPLALLQQPWLEGKRILMLEPRRMAARNAATYMASQLGESVGQTVGYHIRLERKVSAATRLEIITEGLLTQRLQQDPELSDVGLIIFDEFHERHLHADLALALSHQCQQLLRDDLRLLVMSATLDADALAQQLQAQCLHAPGRSYPVALHYRPAQPQETLTQHCLRILRQVLRDHAGDVLVFMPGVAAIRACIDAWQDDSVVLLPLHGQLSDKEQKRALQPQHQRRVIVATNIAESSLTLDGVTTVIDSGLERVAVFQPGSAQVTLQTRPIAQASAEQRSGRAGRQQAGQAYRLWAQSQHHGRAAHRDAEIVRSDLSALVLELLRWGAGADELLWLTPPPQALLSQATDLLIQLAIIDQHGQLSEHGRRCAKLGLEPRWSHALTLANEHGCAQAACELAAYLQQWPASMRRSDDIERELNAARRHPLWQQRILPLAQQWQRRLHKVADSKTPLSLAQLLYLAFPDRIAQRRHQSDSAKLASGQGVQLKRDTDLHQYDWLVAAQLGGQQPAHIELAAGIDAIASITELPYTQLRQRTLVDWNAQGQLKALQQQCLGALVIEQRELQQLDEEQWLSAWDSFFERRGLQDLPWSDAARQWQQRVALMAQLAPSEWPDCSDEGLLARRQQWLLPAVASLRQQKHLAQLDMTALLRQQLSWQQSEQLDSQLPIHWRSPAGRQLTIDYTQQPPRISARLQEFLGCQQHPRLAHTPLSVELLSPANRPIQITADLPGFWHGSYAEVRKDMRGRYPKHHWPEDPANDIPRQHSIKNRR